MDASASDSKVMHAVHVYHILINNASFMIDRHKQLGGNVGVLTWRICNLLREALFLTCASSKASFFSAASAWFFASVKSFFRSASLFRACDALQPELPG